MMLLWRRVDLLCFHNKWNKWSLFEAGYWKHIKFYDVKFWSYCCWKFKVNDTGCYIRTFWWNSKALLDYKKEKSGCLSFFKRDISNHARLFHSYASVDWWKHKESAQQWMGCLYSNNSQSKWHKISRLGTLAIQS